jgi:hypothetical protein
MNLNLVGLFGVVADFAKNEKSRVSKEVELMY